MTEAIALELLAWLVGKFGAQLVQGVFGVKAGTTAGMIIEESSSFVYDVLTAIRSRVTDEKIRAILDAQYVAADAAANVLEDAKFPRT